MKNLRIILPLTLLAVAFLSFPVQPTQAYANTEYAFAIDAPNGWMERYDPVFAPKAFISFVNDSQRIDRNDVAEIMIYAWAVDASQSASDLMGTYSSYVDEYIEDNYNTTITLESENLVKVVGLDCYQFVLTMNGSDNWLGSNYAYKFKEACFVENGIFYQIVFFAQTNQTYDNNIAAFEQSLQTFHLTGTPLVTPVPARSLDELLSLPQGSTYIIIAIIVIAIIVAIIVVSVAVAVKRRQKHINHVSSPMPAA
jgi:hypothetical protein